MDRVEVVTDGRAESAAADRRAPVRRRTVALSSAVVAVVVAAVLAWAGADWWSSRRADAPPRDQVAGVTFVLIDETTATAQAGAPPTATFTAVLVNGGTVPLVVQDLAWGDRPVDQAEGERLTPHRWTFVDFTTTLPCPAPGTADPDPPAVAAHVRAADGRVEQQDVAVLNRRVWDQALLAGCGISPPDTGPYVRSGPGIVVQGATATFTITVEDSAPTPYLVHPVLVADGFASTSTPSELTVRPGASVTAVVRVRVTDCSLAGTGTVPGFALLGSDARGAEDDVVRTLERIAIARCGPAGLG